MPIVELEEFTSLIDFIVRKNYHLNSNCFYPFRNNSDEKMIFKHFNVKDKHYFTFS